MNRKNPPIIVLVDGTSFIPKIGNHTQKIPPITSVKDNKVSSAAGIAFEPIEYRIKPAQTSVPCNENKEPLQLEEKNDKSLLTINKPATIKQKKPESATVVNLGVSFLHLRVTEKTEKPIEEVIPNTKPIKDDFSVFPNAIITIPMVASMIVIQTLRLLLSLKNKNKSS